MANSQTNAGEREFLLALDEIQMNLDYLRISSKVRPRLSSFLDWNTLKAQPDAKNLVGKFLGQKSTEFAVQYRGMIVVIGAAFEEFIRRLIHDSLSRAISRAAKYDDVPEKLRMQNILRTGRVLANWGEPRDHVKAEYSVLAKNLATCVSGATSFTLNVESFTFFLNTMSPSALESMWEIIGVNLNWDAFGRNKTFESMFATKGAKETGRAVVEKLQDFIRLRNVFAHTGAGGIQVTDSDVEEYIAFFRVFSGELVQSVSKI